MAITTRRAFTLIELLVVIAVIALLIGILLPTLGKARKTGRNALCRSNMKQVGTGLHSYAADFKQSTSALSWKANRAYSQWPDLNNAAGDYLAHMNQGVDIVRRKTQRGMYYGSNIQRFLDRNFGHLPMMDMGYLTEQLNCDVTACPEDRTTLIWHRSFDDIFRGLAETGDPDPASTQDFKKLLPFWSTYQMVPASWTFEGDPNAIYQASGAQGYHLLYWVNTAAKLGNRSIADVVFPAQKVWAFDLFDRHAYKRPIWHAYPQAAQPLLFFDGSVSIRKSEDSNNGWNNEQPLSPAYCTYLYYPSPVEPRTLNGQPSEAVRGYYRWTRAGLKGVDFAGREVTRW